MENTFESKKNLTWFPEKCFPFILGGKYFTEVARNPKISCYLLIISNLVFNLFIDIYFVLNLFSSISSLRTWFNLIFYINLVLILLIVIFISYIFLINFLSIRFGPYSFYCYLFYLKLFIKLDLFFIFIPFQLFLFVRFDLHSFDCYLFYLK
jgi:hypothetical protein